MRSSKCLITFIALGLLSAGTVFGSGLVFGAGSIQFPNKAAQAGEFRVSGPDHFQYSRSFEAGESLSFSLYGADGFVLPDGLYKWSIEVHGKAADVERGFSPRVEPVTGTFSIRDGAFVNPNLIEALPNKDQVFLDDLIVNGSICAGLDCSNGESFGFDTLRLKENNLRIKAQDTSNSASFPTVDWQLTFNESSNGGLNKFSVDSIDNGAVPFTVEFGASTNALYVEADSDVGLGTKDPVVELHIKDGDTPTIRLEQDGTSGFTAQTFDIAANETNFFVRDVSNGSTLPFKITPGAPANLLYVAGGSTDSVGIGTSSPASRLHVSSTNSFGTNIQVTGTAAGLLLQESDTTNFLQQSFNSTTLRIRALDSGFNPLNEGVSYNGLSGKVGINCDASASLFDFTVGDGTGNCFAAATFSGFDAGDTALSNTSSRTLKENLQQVQAEDLLEKIAAIDVYTYDFIDGPKDKLGLMAEDFHRIFGRGSDKMLNGGEVQMAMWLAIQELAGQVKELKAELAAAQAK